MRRFILALAVLAGVAAPVLPVLAESTGAQQKSIKEQLVGDWVQVSNITTRADGTWLRVNVGGRPDRISQRSPNGLPNARQPYCRLCNLRGSACVIRA